jgi:hypothetical protein
LASSIPSSSAAPPGDPSRASAPVWLLGTTIALSAFLLFLVEPLIAKSILPWFGGTAAVWTVCLVFFQCVLLAGYLYADFLSRRPARWAAAIHALLLGAALACLPLTPNAAWKATTGSDPAWRVLGLLSVSVGIPYLALSSTSPLLQMWYARTRPEEPPYWLFAISNAASLAALLCYPVLVEPLLSTRQQSSAWSALLIVFAGCCLWLVWVHRGTDRAMAQPAEEAGPRPAPKVIALWILLSACGSMLLLAVTNHLCQNVAPVPLLWVVPLSIYLLTFVVAFQKRNWLPLPLLLRFLAILLGALGYALYDIDVVESIAITVPLFCAALFAGCLFCHGELSRSRPAPEHLTLFYLAIACGGALGAIAVGLLAPRIFDNLYELPLALVLTAVLALMLTWREGWAQRVLWVTVSLAMGVVTVVQIQAYHRNTLAMQRSFYGALRVTQSRDIGPTQERTLLHGTITHGSQYVLQPLRMQPTTYYTRNSGVGLALRLCCMWPKRVGVVGLGAGTLAAYGKPGDFFRFYEINSQVVDIANSLFTYLRESQAKIEVVVGDARLQLEGEPPQDFDVLVVDAFSGDAIPVHLLTKEAMAVYLRHMKPDGIVAFHISNNYLQLAPVVEQLAQAYGYESCMVENQKKEEELSESSQWILVTKKHSFIQTLAVMHVAEEVEVEKNFRAWTDDYNNLFDVLAPFGTRK